MKKFFVAVSLLVVPTFRVLAFAPLHTRDPEASLLVLGTAQYDGRPSRQFEARLKHVVELWSPGQTRHVYTVGGNLPGDRFTEAQVGRDYLVDHGVTSTAITASPVGSDTASSLEPLSPSEVGRVLIVTDRLHSYRAVRIARRLGFDAHPAPTPHTTTAFPHPGWWWALCHESGGVVVQDVAVLLGEDTADRVEDVLRRFQAWLRPSRKARHEELRRTRG